MNIGLVSIHVLILATVSATVALCAMAWWKRPERRLWSIPPATWALHCALLYAAALLVELSPASWRVWVNILWAHTCLLVVGGVWLFLWPARGVK